MKRKGLAAALITIVLAGVVIGLAMRKNVAAERATPRQEAATAVRTGVASRGAADIAADAIGTVQAFNAVNVHARVDGQIASVRFSEGSQVHRGDVLAELDKRPFEVQLRVAMAQVEKDKAQLPAAARNLDRYKDLLAHGAVTQQMVDGVEANYKQLSATVDADQAQADQARLQLEYATVRAPIDGRAGTRQVDAGNLIRAADTNGIVTISQLQPIAVTFALPQAVLQSLLQQQAQRQVKVTARLGEGGAIDEGKLTVVDNQVDQATGTIRCKAIFDNRSNRLWPGGFVNVNVQLDVVPDAVTVPSRAIQLGQHGAYVYVVGADSRAMLKEIKTGASAGDRTVVTGGLQGGEQVIVEGQFQVEDGKRVAATPLAQAIR